MKKTLSFILAAICAASALASCATTEISDHAGKRVVEGADPYRSSSSDFADASWLKSRIGTIPDNVTVGTADSLGINMDTFEDDGYIIRTADNETILAGKTADGLDLAVRKYAKAYEAGQSVPDTTYHEGYRIERLTVAGRDIADFAITYAGGTDSYMGSLGRTRDNAFYAARELQRLIEKATGARLDIVPEAESVSPAIRIGYYTAGDLGENGFTYEVKDGDLIINGAPDANGCDNAVCYMLETECGWEGLLDGDSYLNESDHIDLAEGLSVTVDPMFDFFAPYYRNLYDEFRSDRAYQNYEGIVNRACHGELNYRWGGFYPDWKQLCHSDDTVQSAIIDSVWAYLEANDSAEHPVEYIDLAIGDNNNFCKCKNCMKIIREENLSDAGPIVRFMNRIASELGEDYPQVKFLMFAYLDTTKAPATAPADNVWVTYCDDHGCANHSLAGGECDGSAIARDEKYVWYPNNEHAKNIRDWAKLTKNMYIWRYGCDSIMHQVTLMHNMYEDFQFLREMGFRGLLFEHEYCGLGEGRVRLEASSIPQYHPDYTEEEFNEALYRLYEREFGDGADEIIAYTENYWKRSQMAAGCASVFNFDAAIMPYQFDYPTFHADEEKSLALLEKAIWLADSALQERNCERFSCDLLYKICYYNYFRAYDRGDKAEIDRLNGLYGTFRERMAANGIAEGVKNIYNSVAIEFNPTLEAEAWINWVQWREGLSDEGVEHRNAPNGYNNAES